MDLQTGAAAGLVLAAAVSAPPVAVRLARNELDEGLIDERLRVVDTKTHLPMFSLMTLAGLLFIGTHLGFSPMAIAMIGFLILCLPMVVIDLVDFIIPNEISYGAAFVALSGVLLTAYGNPANMESGFPFMGSLFPTENVLSSAITGMCIMVILYAGLHLLSEDFGMGDVKLSASVGLLLGAFGWEYVVAGFFATFLSAPILSTIAYSVSERKLAASPTVAFGPYMMLGTLLAFPLAPYVYDIFMFFWV